MTMFNLCMTFGVIGLTMLAIIGIAVIVAACKICEMNDLVSRIYSKTCRIDDRTFDTLLVLRSIEDSIDNIHEYLTDEEEECCCGDTEEDEDDSDKITSVVDRLVEIVDAINDEYDELDIHLITPEEYHFANGFSKNELKYYPNSDQVRYYFTDNTYLHMEDIPEYIGDGLVYFGMNAQEPNVVYVRNHILNSDFRIEKVVEHHD